MRYEQALALIILAPPYVAILSFFAYIGKVFAMRFLFRRKGGMNGC